MEIVVCQRKDCNGIVVYNQEQQVFLCEDCNALHEITE